MVSNSCRYYCFHLGGSNNIYYAPCTIFFKAHRNNDIVSYDNDRDLGHVIAIEPIHLIFNFHAYYFRVNIKYTRVNYLSISSYRMLFFGFCHIIFLYTY